MKTYSNKSNAQRAAKSALANKLGLAQANIVKGTHFDVRKAEFGEGFVWFAIGNETKIELPEVPAELLPDQHLVTEKPVIGEFVNCPHCGIHLDNGYQIFENLLESENPIKHEFLCLACDSEFGDPRLIPAKGTGIKIEKDRETRNDVTRPSKGGVCAQIWDICDEVYAKGLMPKPAVMMPIADEKGISRVTMTIQMYQWRKFMGIRGRQK